MSNQINLLFPTAISISTNLLNNDKYKKDLINRCYDIKQFNNCSKTDWLTPVYNTIDSDVILKDSLFKDLINKVQNEVKEFALKHEANITLKCKDVWMNIYSSNDYQESHIHGGAIFSCVYILKASLNSGKLAFFPKTKSSINLYPSNPNILTDQLMTYDSIEDSLFIFQSDVPHMVTQGTNADDRISIAFNFYQDN